MNPTTRPSSTRQVRPDRILVKVVAMLLALAVLAAACGSDDTGDASDAPEATDAPTTTESTSSTVVPTTTAAEPETTEAASYPRTVTHALGTTEIAVQPQVIVSLDMSVTDPVLRLGADVAGYTTYQDPNGSLPDYFGTVLDAQAADAVWVGDLLEPNLELIASVQPDVIISSAVRHEAIYDQLSAIAPTVMAESGGAGWKDNLALVAETLGRETLAETELAAYEARAADVGAAVNAAADDPTVSVVRFTTDAIRLYQPVSFSGTVLEDAGIGRPESQQDREEFILVISEEELALADADVLIYTARPDSPAAEFATGITSRGLWAGLGAVRADAVYEVSDETWMAGVGLFGAHIILDDLESIFGLA